MMTDDMALVREYAERHSEQAFATIVSRHVNLVYSVAQRQVRDPHLAEEITQAVFITLAGKAKSLSSKTILSGWLCRTARFISADTLKSQQRRQARERESQMQSISSDVDSKAWSQIESLLEEGLETLGKKDHDAMVLRFFEGKDLKQVGAAMGLTQDAARMRVSRGVEKLRKFFGRKGVVLSATVISGAVAGNAVQAAPVGLAVTIAKVAISSTSITTTAIITTAKGVAMSTMQKTIICVVVVSLTGGAIHQFRQAAQFRDQVQKLQQQQAPLNDKIRELESERDEAVQAIAQQQSSQSQELLRLRNEVGVLRRATNTLARQTREDVRPKEPEDQNKNLPVQPIPLDSCTFAGYATPESAMQTVAWAIRNFSLNAYLDCFSPEDRNKASEEFQGKTDREIALMLLKKLGAGRGLRLDRKQVLENGAVAFPLSSTEVDDGINVTKATTMMEFRLIRGEWKLSGSGQ